MIGREEDEGVFIDALLLQRVHDPFDGVIDFLDSDPAYKDARDQICRYQKEFCVSGH